MRVCESLNEALDKLDKSLFECFSLKSCNLIIVDAFEHNVAHVERIYLLGQNYAELIFDIHSLTFQSLPA